jgi:hypothetical protein
MDGGIASQLTREQTDKEVHIIQVRLSCNSKKEKRRRQRSKPFKLEKEREGLEKG